MTPSGPWRSPVKQFPSGCIQTLPLSLVSASAAATLGNLDAVHANSPYQGLSLPTLFSTYSAVSISFPLIVSNPAQKSGATAPSIAAIESRGTTGLLPGLPFLGVGLLPGLLFPLRDFSFSKFKFIQVFFFQSRVPLMQPTATRWLLLPSSVQPRARM